MKKLLFLLSLISTFAFGQSTLKLQEAGTNKWVVYTISDSSGIGSTNKQAIPITASGTDTYTATVAYFSAYTTGQRYTVFFTNSNTGAATINFNSIGARAIKKNGSSALASNDIKAGQAVTIAYDGINFQIIGSISAAGGGGDLLSTNNLSDVANVTTARSNLGLGTLATQNGTFSGTSSGINTGDQTLSDATISTTDITTNNFSTTKHGFVPRGTNVGNFLKDDGTWATASGSGTVTSMSITTANGISGSVATATSTPAVTLTLGAIVPTTVNGVTFSGSSTPSLSITGTTTLSGSSSGTNTGDQTTVSGNAGTATTLQNARLINGVSFNGSADINTETITAAYAALGSPVLAQTVGQSVDYANTSTALVDGQIKFTAVYLPKAATLTGVKVYVRVLGSYTGDNNNRIGLYSYSGGNLTLVASSANSASLWTSAANAIQTIPFSGTYSAAAGLYFVGLLYNQSAQTTAPSLASGVAINNLAMISTALGFTNSAKLHGTANGTDLTTPIAMSAITASVIPSWVALY